MVAVYIFEIFDIKISNSRHFDNLYNKDIWFTGRMKNAYIKFIHLILTRIFLFEIALKNRPVKVTYNFKITYTV